MFECLGEQDMDIIIDAMESRHFEPGDYIIKENDPGEELFMVENGEFSCHKVINGEDTLLKYYKSGDVFGELALLYNAPRAASLKAVEPSDAWALDRATFNFIVKDASKKKRETYKNFLSSVHILKNLDVYERSKIADALKEKKVSKGETII
jgi:cAMP-dependent protein kinase regulator